MKQSTINIIEGVTAVMLVVAVFVFLYSISAENGLFNNGNWKADTVTVCKTDTMRDTITVKEVLADTVYFVRYITKELVPAEDTAGVPGKDSLLLANADGSVSVPITQKVYRDSDYTAYVSGYLPQLDSLFLYQKTITNTITQTVTVRKQSRFGFGVTGGIGYGLTTRKPDVFVGVGAYYRLWPP